MRFKTQTSVIHLYSFKSCFNGILKNVETLLYYTFISNLIYKILFFESVLCHEIRKFSGEKLYILYFRNGRYQRNWGYWKLMQRVIKEKGTTRILRIWLWASLKYSSEPNIPRLCHIPCMFLGNKGERDAMKFYVPL